MPDRQTDRQAVRDVNVMRGRNEHWEIYEMRPPPPKRTWLASQLIVPKQGPYAILCLVKFMACLFLLC